MPFALSLIPLSRKTICGSHYMPVTQLAAKLRRRGRGETASYVSWGFKAPVSMLLVPFFEETWGQVKFLHVVRDGRDIAFSGNQTPVDKFYENTFPEGSRERRIEKPPLMAVRMWNVWNSNLYEWAASRVRKSGGDAQQLDYMLLHVEDLIDPAAKVMARVVLPYLQQVHDLQVIQMTSREYHEYVQLKALVGEKTVV